MIPIIEAYPATVARLREIEIPVATPTIDIVAERTLGSVSEGDWKLFTASPGASERG